MRGLNLFIALGALAVLLALVLGKRRSARSPAWLLLRSLFPSWRFFEQIAPVPQLQYRVAPADGDFGPWRDALPPIARTPGSLLLNASGNLQLAYQSLVERLSDDLDGTAPESIPGSVSYELVERLVRTRVALTTEGEEQRFQFQLTLPEGSEPSPFFLSAVHVHPRK
ncbi:MAG TPA: hypothetical protein VG937_12375 [Polyangiaceae bacterium]|nr:hypothetical protein [Polyangiaceae bacterium]